MAGLGSPLGRKHLTWKSALTGTTIGLPSLNLGSKEFSVKSARAGKTQENNNKVLKGKDTCNILNHFSKALMR